MLQLSLRTNEPTWQQNIATSEGEVSRNGEVPCASIRSKRSIEVHCWWHEGAAMLPRRLAYAWGTDVLQSTSATTSFCLIAVHLHVEMHSPFIFPQVILAVQGKGLLLHALEAASSPIKSNQFLFSETLDGSPAVSYCSSST